jgi:antitoxin MazE
MRARIQRWGNSLALRLPKAVVESLGVGEGSLIGLEERNGELVIKPMHQYPLEELLEGVSSENIHTEVSTGTPRGKESW